MKPSRILGIVTVLSVAAVVLLNAPLMHGQVVPPVQLPTQASQGDQNGLRLELSVAQTFITAGQPLTVSVDSFNPSSSPLNASAAKSWPIQGLRADACYSSVYPFGVALFQGEYTAANVTDAKPLQIFPNLPCPLFIRLVTGYYFRPESSNATVLPGTASPISISTKLTFSGTYPGQGSAPQPFSPGTYTLVAGDEWGALVFLHFRVR